MSSPNGRDTIVRYTRGVRTNHWIVAISFVLAALSGLALFHPALFWLSELFGGGPWTRILHPFIALVMVLAPSCSSPLGVWDDNRMQPADWTWLERWRDVMNNREERLPEVGRYNAGQKLLFVLMVACLAGLVALGDRHLARLLYSLLPRRPDPPGLGACTRCARSS